MKNEQAEQLVINNMKLVYYIISKYYPTFIHDEDLAQVGMIGLINAANNWDESKTKFSTFASTCILNEISKEFIQRNKHPFLYSLDYEIPNGEGGLMQISETLAGEEDVDYVDYDGFCKKLNKREIEIMELKNLGYTNIYIGEKLGISHQRVAKILRKLKIKWRMYNDGKY